MICVNFYVLTFILFFSPFTLVNGVENNIEFKIVPNTSDERYVEWDSSEGISRFQKSDAKGSFWNLLRFYEAQVRPTYCSVASTPSHLNCLFGRRESSRG